MINIFEHGDMRKLSRAVEFAYSDQSAERERRNSLIRIFADNANNWYQEFFGDSWYTSNSQYLPLFQQYVRGHMLTLGYTNPKWNVRSKTVQGKAFAERQRLLLNFYFAILDGQKLVRQWGLDTAFGDCIAKIWEGRPPYGVTAPIAPRVDRINPNRFIRDRAADCVEDSVFLGDLYLVAHNEAVTNPEFLQFNPLATISMQPYKVESDASRDIMTHRSTDAYAENVVRLLDLYIPARGELLTFEVPHDSFNSLMPENILRVKKCPINPYELCRLVVQPNSVAELSRLNYLKQLSFLANDMMAKAALQARHSKRNPMGRMGDDSELRHTLDAPDNEAIFVSEPKDITSFVLPGPDPSILQLGEIASATFSRHAGNSEVALGMSPGATTARQTQAILNQIGSVGDYDRSIFETFLSHVGQKLATLTFKSDTLALTFMADVPGTQYSYPVFWGPKEQLPRVGDITDYEFETVASSTAYRSPQEHLSQLQQASQGILQWMMMAAQGATVNMPAIIESYARAYDLVPEITEWWSGEQPTPQERAGQSYMAAMPHQPGGATVNYQGVSPQAGQSF